MGLRPWIAPDLPQKFNKPRSADASIRTISAGLAGTSRGNGQEADPGLSQVEYLFGY